MISFINRTLRTCAPLLTRAPLVGLLAGTAALASAAEDDLRIVPQVLGGTAGFEPGVALEWRPAAVAGFVFRPEVFISEDGRPGGGGAVLYDFGAHMDLPRNTMLSIGPRLVGHNSDDTGWELDGMATFGFALGGGLNPWRHAVGAIGAVGLRDDKRHDETAVGASGGAFYSYRF